MVCNAAQAARQVDTQQLNAIRRYFQEQCPNQALPVIIAVATHCDRLRPIREWHPPYNIQQPDNAKAHRYPPGLWCDGTRFEFTAGLYRPRLSCPEKPAYNIEDGLMRWFTNILTRRNGCDIYAVYVSNKQKATGDNGENRHYERGKLFFNIGK